MPGPRGGGLGWPWIRRTMLPIAAAADGMSLVFIELGLAVVGLALLAGLAGRFGTSTIPLYLLGGLAFGNGGLVPLRFSEQVVHVGAEIGVALLLFMLGLEASGEELGASLRAGLPAGAVDLLLNFAPGLVAGLVLGWSPLAAVLLGGVTAVSSSGIIARVLAELGWAGNPETPTVLTILVLEDLAMAVYLPLVAVLVAEPGARGVAGPVAAAVAVAGLILFAALRYGGAVSRLLSGQSDEVILLATFGLVLLVAGLAQRFRVSAAVGAFLVGVALSGPVVAKAHRLIGPLHDLFAALFFLFFGLEVDPRALPPFLAPAAGLALVTSATKLAAGWWSARRAGVDGPGRLRAGALLATRGEFSIVIAGLGVDAGLEPRLGPLSAAYVLILAVLGPILARGVGVLAPPPRGGGSGG